MASRHTHAGREDIKNRENGRSRDGHREDLIEGEALPGNEDECEGNRHALHNILDDASEEIVHVHLIYIRPPDFFCNVVRRNSLKEQRLCKVEMSEVEDYLTEDPEVNGQKIVLISFLSPEKILKNKEVFFFKNFLRDYDLQWKTSKFEGWFSEQVNAVNAKLELLAGKVDLSGVAGLASEIRANFLRADHLVEEFQQFTRKNVKEVTESTLQEEFDNFVFKNGQKLEEEFFKLNEFRTTMRGIKVRGVFGSEGEAQARAKRLQKTDPNFNIYLGAMGKWMAWEPDPNKVADSEYANEELNNLMKKYRENEENRDVFYNEQKKSRVGAAKTSQPSMVVTPSETKTVEAESSYGGMFEAKGDLRTNQG